MLNTALSFIAALAVTLISITSAGWPSPNGAKKYCSAVSAPWVWVTFTTPVPGT